MIFLYFQIYVKKVNIHYCTSIIENKNIIIKSLINENILIQNVCFVCSENEINSYKPQPQKILLKQIIS